MHEKGKREELDELLEEAWEANKKRQKWAEEHPPKTIETPHHTPKANKQRRPVLDHLRTIEAVSFLLAIGAIVMEHYFWWFVGFIIVGIVIQIVYSLMDKDAGVIAYVTAAFFFLALLTFIFKVVIGSVYPETVVTWTEGNFNRGTNVNGLSWDDGWSELTISIWNKSPDEDIKDFDGEFLIPEGIGEIKQFGGPQCEVARSGVYMTQVTSTDEKTGEQKLGVIFGHKGWYQLVCNKIPARTSIQFVVSVVNTSEPVQQGDRWIGGRKKKPDSFNLRAKYKVNLRPYNVETQITPQKFP